MDSDALLICPHRQCQTSLDTTQSMSAKAEPCEFEVKLQEAEELYRLILSNISDTVLITDDTGAFTYICSNLHVIFGYSPQEARELGNVSALLGNDLFELDELKNSREIGNLQRTITDKAGRNRTLLINVKQVEIQGGTTLYSCRDITEWKIAREALHEAREELERRVEERTAQLRESNALLREELLDRKRAEKALCYSEATNCALLNALPDLIFRIKKDGTFVDFKGANDFHLLAAPSEFLGLNVQDVMLPEIARQVMDAIARARSTFETQVFEYRLVSDKAFPRDYEARIVVCGDDEVLAIVRDITSRKQAEEALHRSQEELQQANEKLIGWVNELEHRNQEMTLLNKMSDFLQSCLTVEEAYGTLATLIQPMFLGSSGGVYLLDATNNQFEAVATWGTSLNSKLVFPSGECWALRRRRPRLVQQSLSNLGCPHMNGYSPPAESLCIPMVVERKVLGLLCLSSSKLGCLTEAKQKLAVTVAEHLALAISNLKLRETLKHESIHDPLTGLFNRRYMEESLKREIYRARRQKQSLGVMMIDIDYFKQFNDTFGHEAGDKVLRKVGNFLRNNIRSSDIACRYGGEEFILILPDASLEDTRKRAEQIREGVKQLRIEHRHQNLGAIAISLGVVCFPKQGLTSEAVIRAADRALYQAKRMGRDRVAVAYTDSSSVMSH